ncbi:ribosome small subunit-dependent GTPase A [Legionella israelensis]|uniref:ribosome small subunit-dependent GTPase A n=1 Tax=Legionella israelensis TaxID=454 RepID=UPI00117C58C4|nr:ribosome small subunit-dependent GTPase A [Legionella israelensis]QDP71128.1 ribosome small subunit-dependent GTPase A [Legionella israelensis]
MSKRRISKQQSQRIARKQKAYQQKEHMDQSGLADGLVISRFGRHAEIEVENGLRIHCSIRPDIQSLVAGDRVVWRPEGQGQGAIVSCYPRQSVLIRPGIRGDKAVAANITQMIVVIAPKPEISWPLLDSYLIMAEILHLNALILLNKTDLPCQTIQQQLIQDYQPLGYHLLFAGEHLKTGHQALEEALNHEVSVFVGQSGVGKSSIIASLLPHESAIETRSISEHKALGRHTTSSSRYYHLKGGGALIDSPGVREISLLYLEPTTIIQGYREFKPFLGLCKFRNCNHITSVGCAVKEAVAEQNISQRRYDNFVKLCQQYAKY